jgi:hypothetical protein
MKTSCMSPASRGKRPLAARLDREEKEGGRDARGAGLIPARLRAADTKGTGGCCSFCRITTKLCARHFGAEPHSFTDDMLTRQLLRDLRRGCLLVYSRLIGIVCKKADQRIAETA